MPVIIPIAVAAVSGIAVSATMNAIQAPQVEKAQEEQKKLAEKSIAAQTNAVNEQLAAQKMEAEAQRKLTEKADVVSEQKSQIETLANLINAKQYYQTARGKPVYTTPIEKTPENIFDQLNNFFDKIFRG